MHYHSFDLEGIAVDGYGYVVTITAGNGDTRKTRSRKYWPFGRRDTEGRRTWVIGRSAHIRCGSSFDEKRSMEIVRSKSLEMTETFSARSNQDKRQVRLESQASWFDD